MTNNTSIQSVEGALQDKATSSLPLWKEELALIQREVSLAFLQRHCNLYWCVPHVHTLQATVLVKMHSSHSSYPVLLFASKVLFLYFALRPV